MWLIFLTQRVPVLFSVKYVVWAYTVLFAVNLLWGDLLLDISNQCCFTMLPLIFTFFCNGVMCKYPTALGVNAITVQHWSWTAYCQQKTAIGEIETAYKFPARISQVWTPALDVRASGKHAALTTGSRFAPRRVFPSILWFCIEE